MSLTIFTLVTKKTFLELSAEARRRRSGYIPRRSLHDPVVSAFSKMYRSKDDPALIQTTGMDHDTFKYLLVKFTFYYDQYSPYTKDGVITLKTGDRRGRKRLFDGTMCLGLVLMWTISRGNSSNLQLIFGSVKSFTNLYISFGRKILLQALRSDEYTQIKFPENVSKIDGYVRSIGRKYPNLRKKRVAYAADGLKLKIEKSSVDQIQNNFYNRWTLGHYVSNIFVFAPDGNVMAMVINAPGCLHDSTVSDCGNIYERLELCYKKWNVRCVVD